MSPKPTSNSSTMQQLGPYMGLGFQLAAAMAFFGLIGWWLDGRWGTAPWLLVAGVMLGAIGGMISIIRTSIRTSRESTRARKERSTRTDATSVPHTDDDVGDSAD